MCENTVSFSAIAILLLDVDRDTAIWGNAGLYKHQIVATIYTTRPKSGDDYSLNSDPMWVLGRGYTPPM